MTAHAGDGLSHVYFSRRAGGVAGRHRTPEFDPGPAGPPGCPARICIAGMSDAGGAIQGALPAPFALLAENFRLRTMTVFECSSMY